MKVPTRPAAAAPAPGRARPRSALFGALAASLLALSCASPLKIDASADPLAILEPGALAYARLSGDAARAFAPALLGASKAEHAKRLLDRTRIAALSMGSVLPRGEASERREGALESSSFQAVLIGDYPFRAASLSLGSDPDWKRVKPAYYNAKLGLYAAVPGPQLVLASNRPLDPLLAAAKGPGASPIPGRLAEFSSRDIVLWAPQPFSGLAALVIGESMDIPVRGLLIAASPVSGEKDRYEAAVIFAMDDAQSLKVYKSVLKLAWYGMARMLFAGDADAALSLPTRTDGELFVISGLPLSSDTLAKILAVLRGGPRS
jgi:hypothetical protein